MKSLRVEILDPLEFILLWNAVVCSAVVRLQEYFASYFLLYLLNLLIAKHCAT